MLEQYVNRTDFTSYEDFKANLRITVPEGFNFAYDVVDATARREPEKLAMVWCDEHGAEARFTFGELKRESDRAARLFQEMGIRKGDPVMLILKRRYEYWFCLLALHKLGAIAIPATHLLTKKDIVYRCNAADIVMIVSVADARVLSAVDDAMADCPTLKHRLRLVGETPSSHPDWAIFDEQMAATPADFTRPAGAAATVNSDIMLLYFTSGTTGMPKMVQHDFAYPLGHILTAGYWQNVAENGLHLTLSDTGWAKAAWGKIYGQWICGTAIMVYDFERFNPKDIMTVVSKYNVTTFCAPPTVYRFLIKEDLSQYDLSALRYCVVAGEPLNPEVYNAFLKATGHKIFEGFGQTETIIQVATWPWMEPKPGSMGKPSPGYDIVIIDEENNPCEVGEEGQIAIRVDQGKPWGMFHGYYRDPELTAKVLHDGLYYTGDLAWKDEEGYLWFVGRADDLIKTSGYRVGPFEVESALLEHPAVMECAITGIPDDQRGQVIKATVVLTKAYTAGDALVAELQEHVRRVTAPYKYPRIIEFVTELPKTISGKIRRVQIREEDQEKELEATAD
jgi:acetyl-CoA synthetase